MSNPMTNLPSLISGPFMKLHPKGIRDISLGDTDQFLVRNLSRIGENLEKIAIRFSLILVG